MYSILFEYLIIDKSLYEKYSFLEESIQNLIMPQGLMCFMNHSWNYFITIVTPPNNELDDY